MGKTYVKNLPAIRELIECRREERSHNDSYDFVSCLSYQSTSSSGFLFDCNQNFQAPVLGFFKFCLFANFSSIFEPFSLIIICLKPKQHSLQLLIACKISRNYTIDMSCHQNLFVSFFLNISVVYFAGFVALVIGKLLLLSFHPWVHSETDWKHLPKFADRSVKAQGAYHACPLAACLYLSACLAIEKPPCGSRINLHLAITAFYEIHQMAALNRMWDHYATSSSSCSFR